jgi:UPF0716 protein FxsA
MAARRRRLPWILLVLFVAAPLAEIYVLIQVGQVIGGWSTIGLLLLSSIVGGWLIRREGARAWRGLREALDSGRMPAAELADGGLILIGGTLMIAPGLISDLTGILLILPLTRPLFRRVLTKVVAARLVTVPVGGFASGFPGPAGRPDARHSGPVVQGEVVDD